MFFTLVLFSFVIFNSSVFGDTPGTLGRCCNLGSNWGKEGYNCSQFPTPLSEIPPILQTVCLSVIETCCKDAQGEHQCDFGIEAAKNGIPCSDVTMKSHESKECCEACQIGLFSGSTGETCSISLSSSKLWTSAFKQCCEKPTTTSEMMTDSTVPSPSTTPMTTASTTSRDITSGFPTTPAPPLDSICELMAGLCAHICVPTPGSFKCECRPGFKLMADNVSCRQEKFSDRCKDANPCQHICYDTGINIQCRCKKGFELAADKVSCNDINECRRGIAKCNPSTETCVNSVGSFKCIDNRLPTSNTVSGDPENVCPPGYDFNAELNVCDDMDECALGIDDCNHDSQVCLNTQGNFTCQNKASTKTCPAGFRMNSTTTICEDIDECENGDLCSPTEICANEPGGYRCEPQGPNVYPLTHPSQSTNPPHFVTMKTTKIPCPPGMSFDSYDNVCSDINECDDRTHDCDSNQECVNTVGSFKCRCRPGFQEDFVTGACIDINECQMNTHDCISSQRCDNTIGSFQCIRYTSCGTGYTLNAASGLCEDDNECLLNTHDCGPYRECRNTKGSFRCERRRITTNRMPIYRPPSQTTPIFIAETEQTQMTTSPNVYSPSTVSHTTQEVTRRTGSDNCEENPSLCQSNQRCMYIHGSYRCIDLMICGAGFVLNEEGNFCEDTDECAENPNLCRRNQKCVNTQGSYRCIDNRLCGFGYILNEEGTYCEDIDECALQRHSCGPGQLCINKPGGYMCQCQSGHTYNRENQCEDIDECERFKGQICSSNSECENTVGSYRCICKNGFRSKTNTICEDIDECGEIPGICHHSCHNLWGAFRCSCKPGFSISKDNRTCTDIDECEQFKDHNLCVGTCVNTPGSYTCRCPEGYRLGSDSRTCQDINECEESPVCPSEQHCVNTRGSFRCVEIVCPPGYMKDIEYKNRCKHMNEYCTDDSCTTIPSSISYNYIALVSNQPIPNNDPIDIFTMRGPRWSSFAVKFTMDVGEPRVPVGIRRADKEYFQMRLISYNQAVISLSRSIEGPQEIEVTLTMELYLDGSYKGNAVAKLIVYVSQYEF